MSSKHIPVVTFVTAGARAFLMQAAHPKVAQGALDHSGFAQDPFGRVYNTIQGMAILIFGTIHEATEMARHINCLHHTVQGILPESIGRYRAGETYNGMEPLALLWVHIVFVDSMLTAYSPSLIITNIRQSPYKSPNISRITRPK